MRRACLPQRVCLPQALRTRYWPRAAPALPTHPHALYSTQVPAGEVEGWVISAIAEGLIDARMDQLAATVVVSRAMQREFGQPQWLQLQGKLAAWKASVGELLAHVEGRGAAAALSR